MCSLFQKTLCYMLDTGQDPKITSLAIKDTFIGIHYIAKLKCNG